MFQTGAILAVGLSGLLLAGAGAESGPAQTAPVTSAVRPADTQAGDRRPYVTESIRGRVVWLAEGLDQIYGITVVPEAKERGLALETTDGRLLPLVEDVRGQSFRLDRRLRQMDVELLVRRYEGLPMLQVIRVYDLKNGKKYLVDYW